MNERVLVLRDAVVKITQMLSGNGIKVTQRGITAFVKCDRAGRPTEVNLPYLPDNATEELCLAIQGFLDHEVAHILFSDFTLLEEAARAKCHSMLNMLEDARIEKCMAQKFSGSASNLSDMGKFFLDKYTTPMMKEAAAAGDANKVVAVLMVPLIRALSGQFLFKEFLKDKMHIVQPILDKIEDLQPRIEAASSTRECLDLAKEIESRLRSNGKGKEKSNKPSDKGDGGDGDGEVESLKGKANKEDEKKESKKKKGKGKGKEKGEEESEEQPAAADPDEESKSEEEKEGGESAATAPKDEDEEEKEEGEGSPGEEEESEKEKEEKPSSGEGEGEGEEEKEGSSSSSEEDEDEDEEEEEAPTGSTEEEDEDEEEEAAGSTPTGGPESEEGAPPEEETELADAQAMWEAIDKENRNGFDKSVSAMISNASADAAKAAPYLIYTKEGDVVEPLPVGAGYQSRMFTEMADKVDHMVGPLQKDLERAISARSLATWEAGRRSGRLHAANLSRLAVGDSRVFRRRHETTSKDVAVKLVIDASGSMSGAKVHLATQAAYALSSVLERIGIQHEVCCFTTGQPVADYGTLEAETRKIGRPFTRIESIYMPVLKAFNERLKTEVKERFGWLPNSSILRNNIDGESIEMASRSLLARRESGKVMIVLSDGAPSAQGDRHALYKHLKDTVNNITKQGVNVVGIGIMSSEVRQFYPKHLVINDVNELPDRVIKELRHLLVQ